MHRAADAGFVMIEAAGIDHDVDLGRWVDAGGDFAESLPEK